MTRDAIDIAWHDGPREPLRPLFELADDSSAQIDSYAELGRVLVATDRRGEIVGQLLLVPGESPDTVELKSMAVRADLQRRGIGRRLVTRALAACRDEGVREVSVTTASAGIGNLRFYQRCGFRVSSVERDTFSAANGYPPDLEEDGIPVRDSITLTLLLGRRPG